MAKIAVEGVPFAADKPYDYRIPEGMDARPGMRVLIPFGRGRRKTEGMILSLAEESARSDCKDIEAVLDTEPLLDEKLLRLCVWIRERVFCSFYTAMKAALPSGLWYRREERLCLLPDVDRETALETLDGDAKALALMLFARGGEAALADCEAALGRDPAAAVKTLAAKGLCESTVLTKRRISDKTERHVHLAVSAEEAELFLRGKRAPVQSEVLGMLAGMDSVSARDVCYYTGATMKTLRGLEKHGIVRLEELPAFRRRAATAVTAEPVVLNGEQEAAYIRVMTAVREGKPCCGLLYGVTGSGKTSVYIRLTEQILDEGGSVLLLVPEIALTPQLMGLFSAHFGRKVALLHSGLSLTERMEQWQALRRGEARVALGTRSAVFAPLQDLRLVIIDEEQEGSYASENAPRYHARDVAKFRCAQHGAVLLLGSATPSVDSYQAALDGKYFMMRLGTRYNRRALPDTRIVNLCDEVRQGNDSTISAALHGEIHANLERGEQTILLLNRRGHNRQLLCPGCGWTPECERCSVALSYHSANGRLMCHYCGHSQGAEKRCRDCGAELRPMGAGTQKVAQDLEALFPGMDVMRMDTDTTGGRGAHEKLLERFRCKQSPVLVGTQMVAKGLDIENVTLVGVLNADAALWMEDYRAHERAFCLFAQVIGRAGRGEKPGRALIQTYAPKHPLITAAAAQDYEGFFREEAAMRRLKGYPPYGQLVCLTLSGEMQNAVIRSALRVRGYLDGHVPPGTRVIGPAPDRVAKVNRLYRYHIYMLGEGGGEQRRMVMGILAGFPRDKQNNGVRINAANG